MSSEIATSIPREDARQGVARRPWRVFAVQLLGPLTIVGGVVWAVAQPYRIVLLDSRGAGPLRLPLPAAAARRPRRARLHVRASLPGSSRTSTRRSSMVPRPESAHWLAASVALLIGLLLIAEVLVGTRGLPSPGLACVSLPGGGRRLERLLWVITIFSTFSTMHLLAHAVWAQAALLAGAVQLALVRGKLRSPRGRSFLRSRSSSPASRSSCTSRTRGCTRGRHSSITRSAGCSSSPRSSRSGRRCVRVRSSGGRGSR